MIPAALAVLELLDKYWLHIAVVVVTVVLLVGMYRRARQAERDREDMRRHVNEATR